MRGADRDDHVTVRGELGEVVHGFQAELLGPPYRGGAPVRPAPQHPVARSGQRPAEPAAHPAGVQQADRRGMGMAHP